MGISSGKKTLKKSDINKINEKANENNNKCVNLKHSVKSIYIIKKIFLYLNVRKQLYLTKCNKFYNNLLEISLDPYNKINEIIKIGAINGFGKEYDLDSMKLIFKGFYKNGKRNGKGKEYEKDNNKLIFEGEYKNGKRHGKGIEYNNGGKLLFEGEYINGKKWNGKAKEYYDDLNIKFNGEYINGKKSGKEYDLYGRLLFIGEYLDEKKWNGLIYDSVNNTTYQIKNGNGIIKEYNGADKLVFNGKYIKGIKKGIEYNSKGEIIFEGEYLDGKRWNGKLKEYKGHWLPIITRTCCGFGNYLMINDSKRNEEMKEARKYENILKYEGEYLNGKRNGKGKEFDINGKLIFEGEYSNGRRKEKNDNNNYDCDGGYFYYNKFEGTIKNGVRNGLAKEYSLFNKLKFEGEYLNGIKNGKAKEYDCNGKLIFEGEFLNGRKYDKDEKIIFDEEYFEEKKGMEKVRNLIIKEM